MVLRPALRHVKGADTFDAIDEVVCERAQQEEVQDEGQQSDKFDCDVLGAHRRLISGKV